MSFQIVIKVGDRVIILPVYEFELVNTLTALHTANSKDDDMQITIVPIFDN